MSDTARLTKQAFAIKPNGIPYGSFSIPPAAIRSITGQLPTAIIDTAYAAIISYAEAISGLRMGSSSWSVIRLYYSAFYSLKTMMLTRSVISFNAGGEMLFDASTGKFLKGGKSSHHWNWNSFRQTALKHDWFISQDSQDAYNELRNHRENVNYTHSFTDPNLHKCLTSNHLDITRRFRSYRDDVHFLYTYLTDHLAIAYPTKLIYEVDLAMSSLDYRLEPERLRHVRTLWKMQDRCPLT